MKLLWIIGDSAVGKMTVGQELMKITDLRLFHNHMSIEFVMEIFGYWQPRATNRVRKVIYEEFAASENYGLIITYMWAFDMQSDWDNIAEISALFTENGAEVYYVELFTTQDVRLQRNATENRLLHKASKRDIEASNRRLINDDVKYRCVSNDGEITFDNYIKIDNTDVPPDVAAQMIKDRFSL